MQLGWGRRGRGSSRGAGVRPAGRNWLEGVRRAGVEGPGVRGTHGGNTGGPWGGSQQWGMGTSPSLQGQGKGTLGGEVGRGTWTGEPLGSGWSARLTLQSRTSCKAGALVFREAVARRQSAAGRAGPGLQRLWFCPHSSLATHELLTARPPPPEGHPGHICTSQAHSRPPAPDSCDLAPLGPQAEGVGTGGQEHSRKTWQKYCNHHDGLSSGQRSSSLEARGPVQRGRGPGPGRPGGGVLPAHCPHHEQDARRPSSARRALVVMNL